MVLRCGMRTEPHLIAVRRADAHERMLLEDAIRTHYQPSCNYELSPVEVFLRLAKTSDKALAAALFGTRRCSLASGTPVSRWY